MAGSRRGSERDELRRFVLPMLLCFVLGVTFSVAILGLNLSPAERDHIVRIQPPQVATQHAGPAPDGASAAVGGGQPARIGYYLAYRGRSALALVVALATFAASLIALRLFVRDPRTSRIVRAVLLGEVAISIAVALFAGSAMEDVARRMTCPDQVLTAQWEFCRRHAAISIPGWFDLHYGFNHLVAAVVAATTGAFVFAIFVVARAREPASLPPLIGSKERCITLLLVGASASLVAILLVNQSFLNWAFAEHLAAPEPPPAVAAYISGTSTFNGAVQTGMLGLTWFFALLLLDTGGGPARSAAANGKGAATGYSAFNVTAILAPVLSALASNLLSGL